MTAEKQNILEVLFRTHDSIREKSIFMKESVELITENTSAIRLTAIFSFFDTYLAQHFRNEELLYGVAKKYCKFSEAEVNIITKILKEHWEIRKKYERLKTLGKDYNPSIPKQKEDFLETFNDIIETMFKHTEKEDKLFYPIFEKCMDQNQLDEAAQAIAAAK